MNTSRTAVFLFLTLKYKLSILKYKQRYSHTTVVEKNTVQTGKYSYCVTQYHSEMPRNVVHHSERNETTAQNYLPTRTIANC